MENAFRALTIQIIDYLWTNPALAAVVVPIFTLRWILRFLRWSAQLARGQSLDDLQSDYDTLSGRFYRDRPAEPVKRPRR